MITQLTESNRMEIENSINEYYQKLNEIISGSEKKMREKFKSLCETQSVLALSHNVSLIFKVLETIGFGIGRVAGL